MRSLNFIVIQALDNATQGSTPRNITISNLTWFAFFLILWPGKYCKGSTDTAQQPFRLKDVQFFIGQQPYNAATVSNAVLPQANFIRLLFTNQKNGVKGESTAHGRTVHPQGFPVVVMRRQVAYLLRHGANRKMPLSSFKKASKWQQIRGDNITAAIRAVFQSEGRQSFSLRRTSAHTPSVQGGYVSPRGAGGPRHHPRGGEVAERYDSPLPPHNGK